MNLFINLYRDKNPVRQKELEKCLSLNLLNKKIQTIYCIIERDFDAFDLIGNEKVALIKMNERPTYKDYFNLINVYASENTVSAIANSDIYFDAAGVQLIEDYLQHNECYALSRWDVLPNGSTRHYIRPDSQDVWGFRGKIKPVQGADFRQSLAGCDNAIAYYLERAGYEIKNPSKTIKTYHIHNSNIRNYTAKDRVPPPYKLIHPHILETTNWIERIKHLTAPNQQSQFSEDIIISHIFKNIGTVNKFFVDLGAGAYDGRMSNTRTLKHNGWEGFGVDCENITDEWIIKEFVTPDNVCEIMAKQNTPVIFDFLNLDLDSSDYWVLRAILENYLPVLVCAEFNGTLDPNIPVALEYEEGYTWDKTNKYGYSFGAGKKLLEEKGYTVIYNLHDTNIFAIRSDLVNVPFAEVKAKRNIYHPINASAKWITV